MTEKKANGGTLKAVPKPPPAELKQGEMGARMGTAGNRGVGAYFISPAPNSRASFARGWPVWFLWVERFMLLQHFDEHLNSLGARLGLLGVNLCNQCCSLSLFFCPSIHP
jgi:hypothetical protein